MRLNRAGGPVGSCKTSYVAHSKPFSHNSPVLTFSHLQNSNLAGVNMRVANLRGSSLKNSSLKGACLAGADLEVSPQISLFRFCGPIL